MGCHCICLFIVLSLQLIFALDDANLTDLWEVFHIAETPKMSFKSNLGNIVETDKFSHQSEDRQFLQRHEPTDPSRRAIGSTVFDITWPEDGEIRTWPKSGNFVTIRYCLDESLSGAQRDAVTWVLQHVANATCVRFQLHVGDCRTAAADFEATGLLFQRSEHRTSGLGRLSSLEDGRGWQPVNLLETDGRYWALHLLGHALGLPHPHQCPAHSDRVQSQWNLVDPRWDWRVSCRLNRSQCPVTRYDPASSVVLAADSVSGEMAAPSLPLPSVEDQLTMLLTRRRPQLSYYDQQALNVLYKCSAHCPLPKRSCGDDGFVNQFCQCICTGFSNAACEIFIPMVLDKVPVCQKYIAKGDVIYLTDLAIPSGEAIPSVYCVLSIRGLSESTRAVVSLTGLQPLASKFASDTVFFAHVLRCSMKMYVFYNNVLHAYFCVLDYFGGQLSFQVLFSDVRILFWSESSDDSLMAVQPNAYIYFQDVIRSSSYRSSSNGTFGNTSVVNVAASSRHSVRKEKMRAVDFDNIGGKGFVTLVIIILVLIGLNYVLVFVIRLYWEKHYGTTGPFRQKLPAYLEETEEEEPEGWQLHIEYSDGHIPRDLQRRESTRGIKALFKNKFFDSPSTALISDSPSKAMDLGSPSTSIITGKDEIRDIYIADQTGADASLHVDSEGKVTTLKELANENAKTTSMLRLHRDKRKKRVSFHESVEIRDTDLGKSTESETEISTSTTFSSDSALSESSDARTQIPSNSSSFGLVIEPDLEQFLLSLNRGDSATSTSGSPSYSSDSSSSDSSEIHPSVWRRFRQWLHGR